MTTETISKDWFAGEPKQSELFNQAVDLIDAGKDGNRRFLLWSLASALLMTVETQTGPHGYFPHALSALSPTVNGVVQLVAVAALGTITYKLVKYGFKESIAEYKANKLLRQMSLPTFDVAKSLVKRLHKNNQAYKANHELNITEHDISALDALENLTKVRGENTKPIKKVAKRFKK